MLASTTVLRHMPYQLSSGLPLARGGSHDENDQIGLPGAQALGDPHDSHLLVFVPFVG